MNYKNQVLLGDALETLKKLPDNTFDSVVTDSPYGLGPREPTISQIIAFLQGARLDTGGDFMGKPWDIPSVQVWLEVYRVLKPGGHVLSFGGTRAFDLISLGLRAAEFEYRDTLMWIYGQGFPKNLDISKSIDKMAGAEHPEAKELEGWGTGLKPAWEPILMFRKPVERTVAANVLKHGTGGINIDGCRVAADLSEFISGTGNPRSGMGHAHGYGMGEGFGGENANPPHPKGRWPTNLLLSHHPDCKQIGTKKVKSDGHFPARLSQSRIFGQVRPGEQEERWMGENGSEEIAVWECVEGCPVKELDDQSGNRESGGKHVVSKTSAKGYKPNAFGTESREDEPHVMYSDSGGASRFFPNFPGVLFQYVAKPSKTETSLNGEIVNDHPTKKPLTLMQWLVRLVTPSKGIVLDPYCGSGTTLHAAIIEGFSFTGIDNDPHAHGIALERTEIVLANEVERQHQFDAFDLAMSFDDDS